MQIKKVVNTTGRKDEDEKRGQRVALFMRELKNPIAIEMAPFQSQTFFVPERVFSSHCFLLTGWEEHAEVTVDPAFQLQTLAS